MKKKSTYLKAITTLVSGSMLAQAITVLCSPIITRLYSPEALGVYSLVSSAVTMFGPVMALCYEKSVVMEPDERKVFPLLKASFIICGILSVIIFWGYLVYFQYADLRDNVFLLALAAGLLVFLMGIINIVTAYNNRCKEYKIITATYIQRIFSQNVCNVAAGLMGLGGIGLSFSQIIGYCAGVKGQAKVLWKKREEISDIPFAEVKCVIREHKKQAFLSAPASFANGLSYSLINYFIEAMFTTTLVGYYSISYRILGMPLTIISINVSNVFLEKASREYQASGNFKSTYKSTIGLMIALGVPMAIIMILWAPWACEVFFGEGWAVAGVYIRTLTPMFILRFIAGGVNCSGIISNRQQYDLIIQIVLTLASVLVFLISYINEAGIEIFLTLLNCSFSVIYAVYIYLFWLCAKGENKG